MIISDVHCHLDYFDEKRREEVIANSMAAGVKAIITNGTTPESNRTSIELSRKYPIVKAALGLHPEFIDKFNEDLIQNELDFIKQHKDEIVAIGEIGLDFHWVKDKALLMRQKKLFEMQLSLAEQIGKPVIVHTREAEQECIQILTSYKPSAVVLHCFSGGKELIKRGFDLGFMFSIPANIVRSKHFQRMAETLPLSRVLSETDAPFLSPYPGRENEPAFISETIKKVAGIKKMSEEEVANILYSNYQKTFTFNK